MIKLFGYASRWELILERCRDRRVLHLGCIGLTEGSLSEKLEAMKRGLVLHAHIRMVAQEIIGTDYDLEAVTALPAIGYSDIVYGDVTKLTEIQIKQTR